MKLFKKKPKYNVVVRHPIGPRPEDMTPYHYAQQLEDASVDIMLATITTLEQLDIKTKSPFAEICDADRIGGGCVATLPKGDMQAMELLDILTEITCDHSMISISPYKRNQLPN